MQFKASAPGSLMLLGEYAVLHGKQALVCAINKRITVSLSPRTDQQVMIYSTDLGTYTTSLQQLKIEKPFQFVLGAFKHYQSKLRQGCDVTIETDFSDQIGLGSSAAVTVATLAVLATWFNTKVAPLDLIRQGRHVVNQVQGVGSGADIAASVYGGVVGYQSQPLYAEKFSVTHPITVLYAGFKTPTVVAIQSVRDRFHHHAHIFQHICHSIGQCASDGIQAIRKNEWIKLGEIMSMQQGMLEALGVSMPILRELLDNLRSQSGILGAKISGSGLGDCVIGLGEGFSSGSATHYVPVEMTMHGVLSEKI
ncbi:MAG: hypothetical protein A3F11_05135 [Gammaproteobacteria bacterium RIFCSPHIGHO2_12_FULL_37_14]|nr:MAG: hypothetical protein A3F11_05135 [Gammaproteobacteria bacterium RIFCSPHIGHO2_12_FULL_37_14]